MRLAPIACSALACCLVTPLAARAYCRTTTIELTPEDLDAGVCPGGLPVYWEELTIHYGFDPSRPSQDLPAAEVREVFAEAFAAWQAVSCEDGSPGFEFVQDEQPYDEPFPYHELGVENVNVVLFRPAAEWRPVTDYDPDAYALTTVWMDEITGRMLGADMEINEGKGPWQRCPDEGCPPGVTDLANVVTHEAGHVVGLGESYDTEATMFHSSRQGDLDNRDLAADDVAGVCEAYSPAAQLERKKASRSDDRGCALARRGQAGTTTAFAWLALAALLRGRRARRQSRSGPSTEVDAANAAL
jgi:hypothetical protein